MRAFAGERGWLDYLLASVCCLSALVSVSLSVGNTAMAWFLGTIALLGLCTSLAVSSGLRKWRGIGIDGTAWTIMAMLAAINVGWLNRSLPDEGFPFQIIAAAWLCWMIVLCSFFSWRDQTLLFLTLPCIALYGLVGTFENYAYGTAMFFAFMVSAATLYARVHHRSMIERAVRAGVSDPLLLSRGPWRWMAGPEWALGSAFVVVLVSLIGAPALRFTVRNVAGRINVALPEQARPRTAATNQNLDQTVGNGPQPYDRTIVMRVKYDGRIPYLRAATYPIQAPRGWNSISKVVPANDPVLYRRRGDDPEANIAQDGTVTVFPEGVSDENIANPELSTMEVKGFTPDARISAPGNIVSVSGVSPDRVSQSLMNGVLITPKPDYSETLRLTYGTAPAASDPGRVNSGLPSFLAQFGGFYRDAGSVSNRFLDFIQRSVGDETNDFRKASLLKEAIARAANYNLRTRPVGQGQDPVDFLLFENKEGYCDLFATAMTRGARQLGMPARYSVGYLVDASDRDENGYINVRRRDYHAWCEIHFQGIGWVPFDATEGALDVTPEEGALLDRPGSALWKQRWAQILVGLLALGGLAYGAVVGRKRILEFFRGVRPSRLVAAHARFAQLVQRQTHEPRRFSETLSEYLQRVGRPLADSRTLADAAVAALDRAIYRSGEGAEDDAIAAVAAFAESLPDRRARSD
ncbi:MAG: transglutaminase domain-containing protein [Fimbriimonadaceae bacterium]|nr:transglutaminase domain-containing protein [Fimbriimonadaceae bacterium]